MKQSHVVYFILDSFCVQYILESGKKFLGLFTILEACIYI